MKKNLLYIGLIGLTSVGLLGSCSDDYLDQKPITSMATNQALGSTKAAQMAVYGIARAMLTQYDVSAPRGTNGEATFNTDYNEALGGDDCSYFAMRELGINWYPWKSMTLQTSTYCQSAWMYAYRFVGMSNNIIANIANATGEQVERDFIEAQARTFRAHGYIKALQWFAPRWQDSNNGEKMAVVLRTEPGTGPAPLASMKDVLDLIYSDLDKAIELYEKSGMSRKSSYEPDKYVAYGLYARAALLRNDWKKAQEMAHNARQGREVMSMDEYRQGFIRENNEYMWTNFDNDVYYSSYGSWFSCNGAYPCNWKRTYGISIDLYNQLDKDDMRRQLYFFPDRVADVAALPGYEDVADLTPADFWSGTNVIVSEVNCMNSDKMKKLAKGFVQLAANNNSLSDPNTNPNMVRWPYSMSPKANPTAMNLGASVKMWSEGNYSDSKYPYMRAAEMYITEAEAAYMAGDEATAKQCLTAIQSKRIKNYTCKTSGAALLDEIKLCRRIELQGEGFNFPDYKRWNIPVVKRAYKEGDPTSGNTPATYAFTMQPGDNNGWRLAIPQQEIDANPGLDKSQLK